MNWIRGAVIAIVVSLGRDQPAQAGCDDWNTWGFFEDAEGDLVRTCLAAGADHNARDDYGHTPLHRAAFSGRAEAIAALIAAGADPGAKRDQLPVEYWAIFRVQDCPLARVLTP